MPEHTFTVSEPVQHIDSPSQSLGAVPPVGGHRLDVADVVWTPLGTNVLLLYVSLRVSPISEQADLKNGTVSPGCRSMLRIDHASIVSLRLARRRAPPTRPPAPPPVLHAPISMW